MLYQTANAACNNQHLYEKANAIMKLTSKTDDFIRKGKIGGYKEEMPQDYIERFDAWIAQEVQLSPGFPRINK